MTTTLKWNTLSTEEWEEKFSRLPRSNILQNYDYARAYCPLMKQKARWGVIEIDGIEAGLVQIFEAGLLWNLIHAVMLDRGPLWFEGFGTALHIKRFFEEFNRQFPVRRGRKRRILPEVADGPSARKMISQHGFTRLDRPGYETIWIDLTQHENDLRAAMKSNWRGKLNKAEKSGIDVHWDGEGEHLGWVTGIYAGDKAARGYGGPSAELLRRYVRLLLPKGLAYVGRAMDGGDPVAFVVIALHGRSATYLAGWSSDEGRDKAAHHLLLWEGMKRLKAAGIKEFDLGGINDEGAAGVKTFKEGLGGDVFGTVGHYV